MPLAGPRLTSNLGHPARLTSILGHPAPSARNFIVAQSPCGIMRGHYAARFILHSTWSIAMKSYGWLVVCSTFVATAIASATAQEMDLKRDGAFGFPQREAQVLCDNRELRVSAWS